MPSWLWSLSHWLPQAMCTGGFRNTTHRASGCVSPENLLLQKTALFLTEALLSRVQHQGRTSWLGYWEAQHVWSLGRTLTCHSGQSHSPSYSRIGGDKSKTGGNLFETQSFLLTAKLKFGLKESSPLECLFCGRIFSFILTEKFYELSNHKTSSHFIPAK